MGYAEEWFLGEVRRPVSGVMAEDEWSFYAGVAAEYAARDEHWRAYSVAHGYV